MKTTFNVLVFKANLVKELQIKFSKTSNEKESSNFTSYSYFFILFQSIAIYAIKGNRRYQKDCWHWEKKSRELKRLQKTSFQKHKKNCSTVFFMKIEPNSFVRQGDTVYFTQSFSKRKVCSPSLVSNQTHNNFHVHEVSSQNNFKTFIWKNKRLKGRLPTSKKNSGIVNQYVSWKITPLEDTSVNLLLKKIHFKKPRYMLQLVLAVTN